MKIVNKQQFYKLKSGTLYSDYSPSCFNELNIKGDTLYNSAGNPIDYYYEALVGNVSCDNSDELFNTLCKSEEDSSSFSLEFNVEQRDGMYEEVQMYAVYEEEDLKGLIKRLQELL